GEGIPALGEVGAALGQRIPALGEAGAALRELVAFAQGEPIAGLRRLLTALRQGAVRLGELGTPAGERVVAGEEVVPGGP
ncbi:MAG TPA: hypothetical protein VMR00_03225, partial [Streptosporangiaceae bacterium]|nr:hypothetical protein [Streptosporangiaceae bacterium]